MIAAGEWAFIEYVQMKVADAFASERKLLCSLETRSSYGCHVKSGSVYPTKAVLLENEIPFIFYETPEDVWLGLRVLKLPVLLVNYPSYFSAPLAIHLVDDMSDSSQERDHGYPPASPFRANARSREVSNGSFTISENDPCDHCHSWYNTPQMNL
jgi:hypothetical protein